MRVDGAAYRRWRRMSLTSLIDVIFLLLLFFMLTATFSRFSDVELKTGAGGAVSAVDRTPVFLRLDAAGLSLNGSPIDMEQLQDRLSALHEKGQADAAVLSVREDATAQQLVDVIVVINRIGGLPLQIVQ